MISLSDFIVIVLHLFRFTVTAFPDFNFFFNSGGPSTLSIFGQSSSLVPNIFDVQINLDTKKWPSSNVLQSRICLLEL